ncbi:MAG TPA: TraC family protein [Candidatus Paceibacterota bacterium]
MALNAKTTQDFVPIKEIKQGIIILKDDSMRAIVMASSLNFALKSADEQQSIIMQFQNFLNSLDFSVQVFIQSRKLDIRPYIALLEARLKEQMSDLLKIQTREYISFIKNFTENSNIMTKTFFVVVPYSPATLNAGGVTDVFSKKKTAAETAEKKLADFEERRSQLEQRVGVVTQGLARCGIRTVELGTEEIVEVFYKIFNPGDTEKPIPLA